MATQVMAAPPPPVSSLEHQHDGSTDAADLSPLSQAQSLDNLSTSMTGVDDEVRTLFVSGLPMDAKPRELYLLFRGYKGYEGSLLKITNKNGKNTSPVGFVTFTSKSAAESAKLDLQGVKFDLDLPQTLRLEFAKSNTKVTKPKTLNNNTINNPALHQAQAFLPFQHHELAAVPFLHAGAEWSAASPLAYDLQALQQHQNLAAFQQLQLPPHMVAQMSGVGVGVGGLASAAGLGHLTPAQLAAVSQANFVSPTLQANPIVAATSPTANQMQSSNTPSNTLFVSNIGTYCIEPDIHDLFATFPGFVKFRRTQHPVQMQNGGHSFCAFVEYSDVQSATLVMKRLQGHVLRSGDMGSGIRIEFAKTKILD
ncbi:hypothetical protein EB796_016947 [Bugula neritina]|uniref:RRM domain-containing protein n=1 Tax=Bugula neritina TaxID=10212 RepID=A0A7J7JF39_BUGNE|nr:hypothetical protein EB796_016947 [Bugula neritina]